MLNITLSGFKEEEIKDVSGMEVSLKRITIPGEDCSNFIIRYKLTNQLGELFSGSVICFPSPYQKDISQVNINELLIIRKDFKLTLKLESTLRQDFNGKAIIDYETSIPAIQQGMKVFISERDRQIAFRTAFSVLARFYNIPDWEYDDNQVLYNKLITVNDDIIVRLLRDYINAYNRWFNFYMGIKEIETKTGSFHSFNDNEKQNLSVLINNREGALNALQNRFDELQLARFNKAHGLGNVDGIIL